MHYVSFAIDWIMVIVFSLSFFSKLFTFDNFILHIRSYKIVPSKWVAYSATIILIIEMLIVLGFAVGDVVLTNMTTILLLVAFSVMLKLKKETDDCGCFGDISWLNRLPLLRNAILIFLVAIDLFIHTREFMFGQNIIAICTFLGVGAYILVKAVVDRKRLEKWVLEIKRFTGDNQSRTIIFLDYNQPNLKEIERVLLDYPTQAIIILKGPAWLIKIKEAAWKQHIVIDSSCLKKLGKLDYQKPKIVVRQNRKWKIISEVTEYMKDQAEKKSEPVYPI
ncbi:hypothetical protein DUZ99_09055 [Xylanibacillus composti]|uniref:Methylamine utilisation protein MauE domain-containing protein n=1 Tax=Xylanibacillus composti TaxID=1572762 RepID=A0A8J4M0P4_9BACL|nr:MauE/DoxX family redox-associated membrane protein [Xylanibacillus composti]MDT9725132.1 hypothetical protein [Xylanibacillus composti]GIQ67295.1 hypothetical protein XYCOK13_01190 [Xylanibacillus composti]